MKVVYSGTRNLYPYMAAAIKSLLAHNKVETVYLLIEDDEFPYKPPKCCKCINVSNQTYFPSTGVNFTSPFTYFCLLRVCYAELLPDEDKIIQLDVDTIVNDSIEPIWDIDLTRKWFAMCPEYKSSYRPFGKDKKYYNAGVAVFNLAQIRKDNIMPTLVEYLNTVYSRCMDQEAWNYFGAESKAVDLPIRYNECFATGRTDNPAIVHYAGVKNWTRNRTMFRHEYLDKYIDRSQRYMIHSCNDREWYVTDFLVPSMIEQGIRKENIIIWQDKDCVGNLASFVGSCRWIVENEDPSDAIWHLQDDVVISKNFFEKTNEVYDGMANGFCNDVFDAQRANYFGVVPASGMWFSFQCVLIPNATAKRFVDWFENDCVPNHLYDEFVSTGRCDDTIFNKYILSKEPQIPAMNIWPCIVDHIDYLIGGTTINKSTRGEGEKSKRIAYWRSQGLDEAVKELKEKLPSKNFSKNKKGVMNADCSCGQNRDHKFQQRKVHRTQRQTHPCEDD